MHWLIRVGIIIVLASGSVRAACIDSLWQSTPQTQNNDYCGNVVTTSDGNILGAGYGDQTGIDQGHGWIIKLNPATGSQFWSRQYTSGIGTQSVFLDVANAQDDGFIAGGWARREGSNQQHFWLYRINSNGDSVWSRTFGNNSLPFQATSVIATQDGGYAIAGRAHSLPGGFGNHDWLVIKTNANGDSLWSLLIGDSLEDTCNDMILSQNGTLVLMGSSLQDETRDGRMTGVSLNGQVMWNRTYTFEPSVIISSAVELPNQDGYMVCGYLNPGNSDNASFIMETTNSGQRRWDRTYDLLPNQNDIAHSIESDGFGGYYVIGYGYPNTTSEADVFVLHISACGDSLNTTWIGGEEDDASDEAMVTPGGQIVICGTNVHDNAQREMLLYGLSADTCNIPPCSFSRVAPEDSTMPDLQMEHIVALTWTPSHDAEGAQIQYIFHIESTYPEAFFVSPHDTVSTDTFYHLELMLPVSPLDEIFDFRWTVKATDGIDTVEASNDQGFFQLDIIMDADDNLLTPKDFTLSAFPNPFNPTTTLNFTLTQSSHVQLDLFDIQGRLVQTMVNNIMTAGSHNVSVDGTALSSGIYFANLRANDQTRLAKLVLLK